MVCGDLCVGRQVVFFILVQLCHIFYHETAIILEQRGYMHFVLPVHSKSKEGDIRRLTISGK